MSIPKTCGVCDYYAKWHDERWNVELQDCKHPNARESFAGKSDGGAFDWETTAPPDDCPLRQGETLDEQDIPPCPPRSVRYIPARLVKVGRGIPSAPGETPIIFDRVEQMLDEQNRAALAEARQQLDGHTLVPTAEWERMKALCEAAVAFNAAGELVEKIDKDPDESMRSYYDALTAQEQAQTALNDAAIAYAETKGGE